MKNVSLVGLLIVLLCGVFVGASAMYTVDEVEQVIITQFGKPVVGTMRV